MFHGPTTDTHRETFKLLNLTFKLVMLLSYGKVVVSSLFLHESLGLADVETVVVVRSTFTRVICSRLSECSKANSSRKNACF
jgi:hypothetical protein